MTRRAFVEWQPIYAEVGIPTFPVRDKKPAVSNYLHIGIPGSTALRGKFANDNAFGFALGSRTNITVLDIDSSNQRHLRDALDRYGETYIIVRTPSGGFHCWYRHNGERRQIRPIKDTPVDILGSGFVVAPASGVGRGVYGFVEGGLDDLDRLPPMQDAPVAAEQPNRSKIEVGRRNDTLWRYCMRQAPHCDDVETLIDVARTYASDGFMIPMSDAEIVKTARSAWHYEIQGRNLFGRGGAAILSHEVLDNLAARDPEAFALYCILLRHHGCGDEFALAKAMADALGWPLRRFKRARERLVTYGAITCVKPGGRGPGDPPRYRFA